MRRAVFVDRDGTLIRNIPYNSNPALLSLESYAGEMLQVLKNKNYLLFIISNQPGIAKGFISEEGLYRMHEAIRRKLLPYNVQLDGIYYCPHFPDGSRKEYAVDCDCRKPRPGLIYKAAKNFNIDLTRSWMIGDILNDVEAGNTAGCKTILLNNGNETEWVLSPARVPTFSVRNLKQATEIILRHEMEPV